MIPALEVTDLAKRYGATTALRGVDLVVAEGELVGLLGPNGAGKSTLVKSACGLVRPSGGSVRVCGAPAGSPAARRALGEPAGAPHTRTLPPDGRTNPQALLTSVDLPAPLGPSSPTSSPSATTRSTPRSAVVAP